VVRAVGVVRCEAAIPIRATIEKMSSGGADEHLWLVVHSYDTVAQPASVVEQPPVADGYPFRELPATSESTHLSVSADVWCYASVMATDAVVVTRSPGWGGRSPCPPHVRTREPCPISVGETGVRASSPCRSTLPRHRFAVASNLASTLRVASPRTGDVRRAASGNFQRRVTMSDTATAQASPEKPQSPSQGVQARGRWEAMRAALPLAGAAEAEILNPLRPAAKSRPVFPSSEGGETVAVSREAPGGL
jgi:hypothetical protein